MDPKEVLKSIKTYINLLQSEDPIRMQSLVDLEKEIRDLRYWLNKGGFVPEGLTDNRDKP